MDSKTKTPELSIEEFVKKFDTMWKKDDIKDYSEMYSLCISKIHTMNKHVLSRLARLYRDGKGTEKNLSEAARLMYLSIGGPSKWAEREYVEILISLNTEESRVEAFLISKRMADEGIPFGQNRVSRMYRRGIGTKKNITKAVEYMSLAVKNEPGWSREYVDLLLSTHVPAYWARAFEYATKYPNDDHMLASLSIMLETGKGVEKNIQKSLEYMDKAVKINDKWFIQYIDLLILSNQDDNLKKAFGLCVSKPDDNPAILGRIARMYRDGTGTEKDMEKAKKYMKKAADLGNVWASEEYKQMIE